MTEVEKIQMIIDGVNGDITLDELCELYSKKYGVILFAGKRDKIYNAFKSIIRVHKITNENVLDYYLKNILHKDLMDKDKVELIRAQFVKDYPIDSIKDLTLNEYLVGSSNSGTFCNRIRSDLQILSSLGNAYPDMFGIYLKGGSQLALHKTYANYGTDFDEAFEEIKTIIFNLLTAANTGTIEDVANIKLHSQFKSKLLSIYYPEKFIPVCVWNTLNEYCNRIGVKCSKKDIAFGMHELSEWKYRNDETKDWDNFLVMRFCDWLWRENKSIV